MALNTIAAGRAWLYSHNIGRNAQAGMGFSNPVGVAVAKDGVLYVATELGEQIHDHVLTGVVLLQVLVEGRIRGYRGVL